jgi:hypothetical protein
MTDLSAIADQLEAAAVHADLDEFVRLLGERWPAVAGAIEAKLTARPIRPTRVVRPLLSARRNVSVNAAWTALPFRDRQLLLWLVNGRVITSELATLLIYRCRRTSQRRLRQLSSYGFIQTNWAGSEDKPRGQYIYTLSAQADSELEAAVWPDGRPDASQARAGSGAAHEVATHDLLAAFLTAASEDEGLVAWLPERTAARLFDNYVRPDALAVLRTGGRGVLLLVERDLGTEVTATLASKIARYRNKFAGRPCIHVGFVVEGERRAESVRRLIRAGEDTGPAIIVTTIDALRADPFGARWSDGATKPPTRGLTPYATGVTAPLLGLGCLDESDALAAFDHRAIESVPALRRLLSVGEATR